MAVPKSFLRTGAFLKKIGSAIARFFLNIPVLFSKLLAVKSWDIEYRLKQTDTADEKDSVSSHFNPDNDACLEAIKQYHQKRLRGYETILFYEKDYESKKIQRPLSWLKKQKLILVEAFLKNPTPSNFEILKNCHEALYTCVKKHHPFLVHFFSIRGSLSKKLKQNDAQPLPATTKRAK